MPSVTGEATLYCNTDYPATITAIGAPASGTYDAKSGEVTSLPASGSYKTRTYCDGSAAALQVAAVVAAAATISMYWDLIDSIK